ncbi:MAG: NAD-dependent epimerase/dehydratase family protein [Elusimicrobia bacterium]|nr:NAD-dependent epimerase/dehydratase family protein [Elusimicrobiota bacterium]
MDSGPMDLRNRYRGKTVVITGASGYIASALVERLAGVAAKVIRVSRGALPPLPGCTDLAGDVAESETWRRVLPGADSVFHLAAQTSFYKSAEDPDADFRANVIPMRHLLETCRKEGFKPFIIFSGSTTEAGLPLTTPIDESHPDAPITVYDLHKLLSEKLLEGYARQGYARGTTLRLSNVYGPGPKSSSSDRGILNAMIARALRGDRLTVYGSGEPVRDYLYIDDMAAAFLAAGCGAEALNGRHFVMGSGRGMSLRETFRLVAARVQARTGRTVEVASVPEPAGLSPIESRRFVADASAFRKATGWAPAVSLEAGIDLAIDFAVAAQGVA